MAILTLITDTAATATPACWTADPRAAALLASCAKNMPTGRYVRNDWERNDYWVYTGWRAARLVAIRTEIGDATCVHWDATGDRSRWDAWASQPTVAQAIDAAPMRAIYAELEADVATIRRAAIVEAAAISASFAKAA